MLKRFLMAGAALAMTLAWGAADAQQKTRVTVYTALESDQLQPYKQAFESENPDIDIQWVRESTGVITSRFLAEKDNPRADVVWGLAVTSIIAFDKAGLVHPYTPKGADQLKPAFRSTTSPMAWTGMDAWLAVVCVNTVEQKKAAAPMPASWMDLTDPKFKGQVVMPNPSSSGTGFLAIAGWIKAMGEQGAWSFMDKLHDNVAVYTHSGSAPCVQAARGERMVGIGFDMRGASEKTKGAPIELVIPKEGSGWDMEATAIVKGTKNLAAAQRVADFAVSRKANELYGKYYAIVATPGLNVAPPNYPTNAEPSMLPLDLAWMSENRDRILAEWTKRYDGKSAPR